MRVLDFDNTIYDGESVLDFYLFSIKYNPRVLKYIFKALRQYAKYKMGRTKLDVLKNDVKKYSQKYLSSFSDLEGMVMTFWDKKISKMKKWYTPQDDDVIMTASFDALVGEACKRLGIKNCIASVINRDTLEVEYLNFGVNKKEIFYERYGVDAVVEEFYTDSKLDTPMIEIAEKAFWVKGKKVKRIK